MTGEIQSLGRSAGGNSSEPSYMTQRSRKLLPTAAKGKSVRYNNDGIPEHILSLVQHEIKGKLKSVLRKKAFYGYPFNMPFTDVNMVIERVSFSPYQFVVDNSALSSLHRYVSGSQVKSMCLHETKHPNVQFVLAVKVRNARLLWLLNVFNI